MPNTLVIHLQTRKNERKKKHIKNTKFNIYARGLVLCTFGDVLAALVALPSDWECCECALVGLPFPTLVPPLLRLTGVAVGFITSASLFPAREPPEPGGEPPAEPEPEADARRPRPGPEPGASASAVVGESIPVLEGEVGIGGSVAIEGRVNPALFAPPLLGADPDPDPDPEVLIGGGAFDALPEGDTTALGGGGRESVDGRPVESCGSALGWICIGIGDGRELDWD